MFLQAGLVNIEEDRTANIPGVRDADIVVLDQEDPETVFEKKKPNDTPDGAHVLFQDKKDKSEHDEYLRQLTIDSEWNKAEHAAFDIYGIPDDIDDGERNRRINDVIPPPKTEFAHEGIIRKEVLEDLSLIHI